MLCILEDLAADWRGLDGRIDGLSSEIEALARQDKGCERLMTVPGIGPIISRQIDLPLVGGAALFGVGWGLAGICPGPALTDLVTLEPKVLLFVAAMLLGMIVASEGSKIVSEIRQHLVRFRTIQD